ncbi:hypothetical protein A6723_005375 [Pseudomonas sp. AU11447]|nr:hypothetical protein A6723_005375 [Pseudomonas sp. AU11447]
MLKLGSDGEGGKMPLLSGGQRSAYGAAVTSEKDSRQGGFTPAVTQGAPTKLFFAPLVCQSQGPTDLSVGHYALMKQNQIGW